MTSPLDLLHARDMSSNNRARPRSEVAPPHSAPNTDSPRGPPPLYQQSRSMPEPSSGGARTPLCSPSTEPSGLHSGPRGRALSESGVESAESFDSIPYFHAGQASGGPEMYEYLNPAPHGTVIHAYEAQEDDELWLEVGDVVQVLSKDARDSGADGWWVGVRQPRPPPPPPPSDGATSPEQEEAGGGEPDISGSSAPAQMGIFPCNYVIFLEECGAPQVVEVDASELQIGECVGSGGFGEVRVASWPSRQIEVALKLIHTDHEADVLALQREARYLCMCRHPNIVPMHGLAQLGPGRHALVMEFAAGGSLNRLLAQRAVCSPAVLLDWAMQIARGMCYLHEDAPARIYHRDLKSSNVLIREPVAEGGSLQGKTLLITDFGLARSIQEDYYSRENAAAYLCDSGTYAWMSPEALKGRLEYSAKSDIWSYGVLLWELLTGDVPYKGMEPCHVIYSVGNGKCGLFIPEDCPEIFRELLRDCWHRQPDLRPSFRIILERLGLAREGAFMQIPASTLLEQQRVWRDKIHDANATSNHRESDEARRYSLDSNCEIDAREEQLLRREQDLEARCEQLSMLERNLFDRQRALEERETELLLHVSMQAWAGPTRPAPPPKRPSSSSSSSKRLFFRRNKPSSLQIGKPSSVVHVLHVSNTPEDGSPRLRVIKNPEPLKGYTWGPSVTHQKNRRSTLSANQAKNLAKSAPNLQKYPPLAETDDGKPCTCSRLPHSCGRDLTDTGSSCVSFLDWFLRRLGGRRPQRATERGALQSGLMLAAVGLGALSSCPVAEASSSVVGRTASLSRSQSSPRRRDAYYAALSDGYLRFDDASPSKSEAAAPRVDYRPGYATVGHAPASQRPSILSSGLGPHSGPRTVTFERPSNLDLLHSDPSPSPPAHMTASDFGPRPTTFGHHHHHPARQRELPQPTTPSDSTGYGSCRATPHSPHAEPPTGRLLRQLSVEEEGGGAAESSRSSEQLCISRL